MKTLKIKDSIVVDCFLGEITTKPDDDYCYLVVEDEIDVGIGWVVEGRNFFPPSKPTKTTQDIVSQYTEVAQRRLDEFARTRNYTNILAAVTYASSSVQKFKSEAKCAIEARDATWGKCYEILSEVESGDRDIPTIDEFLAELPVLQWKN